jgi:transcriptional regulator with XRE-family HTH domain
MKNDNLGREIRRQRTYLRIPQALIAAKIGRTQRWVSMIERGELPIDRKNAAKVLAVISRIGKETLLNIPQDYSGLKLSVRLVLRSNSSTGARTAVPRGDAARGRGQQGE